MASQVVKCRDGPVPHPSLAFQLKCERESEKLRVRLKKQLQNDMLNLFQGKTFSDLTLVAEDQQRISAHSSLLKVRVPGFYNHCLVTLDNCVTRPKKIVELPGVSGTQLQKFIRTVYCGEETGVEEASVLELLSRVDSCVKLNVKNAEITNLEKNIKSQKMEIVSDSTDEPSPHWSNHQVTCPQPPSDNDGNYEVEEYSSFSEGLNCNGTLADLTDPFSASASELMNVSTLNANDDVSIVSAEEFVGSDGFDACEPFSMENPGTPATLGVEDVAYLDVDRATLDTAEKSEVLSGSSALSFDLEANLMEPSEHVDMEENRNGSDEFESDINRESHLDMDICDKREVEFLQTVGIMSVSDEYEKSPLGPHVGSKTSADETHLMVRSNESKDCDSGVCFSISRKLSTSSGGRHSPCCSENLQDSPTGSLPKDDSLEFCADSLASDDTPHVPAAGLQPVCFRDSVMDMDWNVNAAYQLDLTKECIKRPLEVMFSEEREVSPKKQAWPDEGHLKSILKPSAVVPPYNAEDDAEATVKISATMGDGEDANVALILGGAANANLTQSHVGAIRRSVQLDFVPFLEERTASNVGAESKPPLHPGLLEADVLGLDGEYLLTAQDGNVSVSDLLATKDFPLVGDAEFVADTESEDHSSQNGAGAKSSQHSHLLKTGDLPILDAGCNTNVEDLLTTKDVPVVTSPRLISELETESCTRESEQAAPKRGVAEHQGIDIVTAKNQSGLTDSGIANQFSANGFSLVDDGSCISRFQDRSYADGSEPATDERWDVVETRCRTIEPSLIPKQADRVFITNVLESEAEEEALEKVHETFNAGSESQIQKPDQAYFMFIDVSGPEPASVERGPEESAVKEIAPRKKPAEAFFFVPSDAEERPLEPSQPPIAFEECHSPKAAPAAVAHQPVYMYIEATSPASSTNSGHSTRLGQKRGPVLRRRARTATANVQRPKSESAATLLLEDASKLLVSEKASKRASLAFGVEEDTTYSIEVECREVEAEEVRAPPSPDKWCSKLGRDLLRMFLDEVDPDVVIRVDGVDIKAHKSVLASRCVYFAAMLSGSWVESAGNIIKMQGFSYDAVHFALCHIYGGSTSVPDTLEVSELASLADMLGLEGLKEVVALALKMKYCHFFHKPCSTCTTSVSECLLIATSYGLEELQDKCQKWIAKHMMKAWPTKAFAALPDEILQKCYCVAKMEITADTVLDTLLRCDKLMATLPHVKWTEPVFSLTSRLAETASAYLATHFPSVLSSSSFLALHAGQSWSIHALETTFLLAIDRLPLDCACQAYIRLHDLLYAASQFEVLESTNINENFDALLSKIHRQVELFLIHNANRIVRCKSWSLLTPDLQKKIKDAAVIVFEFGKPTAAPPQLSSLNRKFTRTRASNSTSSASPTIERARFSSAASLSQSTRKGGAQGKVDSKAQSTEGCGVKAATLPRTKEVTRKSAAVPISQQGAISEGAEAARNHHHVGSRTLPLTKTTEIRKKVEADLNNRRQGASSSHAAQASKNVQSCKSTSSESSNAGPARPKSWPVRDKPIVAANGKSKDKTPARESLREPTTSGITLRSTARQSTLTNGNSKPTTPSAPRPKSAVYNSTAGRSGKPACNGNVRDSKASNLRKAASSDLHGKENIDELRPRSSARPRSEVVSSPVVKRGGQRLASTRSSRLTSTSKP